jgi:hypothetical protein
MNVHQLREIERMEAYQKRDQRPAHPSFVRLFNVLLVAMVLLLIAIVAIKSYAAPEDHALCRALTQTAVSGREAVWIDYPEGWADMPADLINLDILPIPDEALTDGWLYSSGYDLKFSPSEMELWVFPYWSFEWGADANGEHGGTHDLCPVLIYDLSGENG